MENTAVFHPELVESKVAKFMNIEEAGETIIAKQLSFQSSDTSQ